MKSHSSPDSRQSSLFSECQSGESGSGSPEQNLLDIPDGHLELIPDFFPAKDSESYFKELYQSLNWSQDNITIAGKTFSIPRLQAWYGDKNAHYDYSGSKLTINDWTPLLLQLRNIFEQRFQAKLNSVLCNLYRNGQDSVSWHSDNERPLGPEPFIVSLSLGATRTFSIQHKKDKSLYYKLRVHNNTVITMSGSFQRYWRHQVPKTKAECGPRINLTFRYVNHQP